MTTRLTLNGRPVTVDVPPDTPLLWTIRDALGLTGTKFGCGIGMCGACTVHVNGRATRSCITPISTVRDASITTIEGLGGDARHPLQNAWIEAQVPQCGYCQSGQIMQAAALLNDFPNPDDQVIDAGTSGKLCRCMAYIRFESDRIAAGETQAWCNDGGVRCLSWARIPPLAWAYRAFPAAAF